MKITYIAIAIILAFSPATAKNQSLSRIVAVVNHDVITAADIDSRLNFFRLSAGQTSVDKASLMRMVMQSLIFESLQRQAAESKGIKVADNMVKEAVEKAAKNNNMSSAEMERFFSSKGVKIQTFKDILSAQIAWVEYVRAMHGYGVQVSESEIDRALEEIKSKSGESQYDCVEVFLSVDSPNHEAAVRQDAEKISQQLRTADHPQDIARQFSQAPSAQNGGQVFFTDGRLEPTMKEALKRLNDGDVSAPVRVTGGFKVVKLLARRFAGEGDPLEAEVTLTQIAFEIRPDATPEDMEALKSKMKEFEDLKGPKAFEKKVVELGGKANQSTTKLRDLPAPVVSMIRKAGVGKTLPPIQPDAHQVLVMMPCALKKAEFKLPSRDEIMQMLQEEKLSKQAQRDRMRLYSAAFIDVKDPQLQSALYK